MKRIIAYFSEMGVTIFCLNLLPKSAIMSLCQNSILNPATKQSETITPRCANTTDTTPHTKVRSVPLLKCCSLSVQNRWKLPSFHNLLCARPQVTVLKRDLPHIPFAQDFWGFANAGKALANLHVNYESVPKYEKLELKETPHTQRIDWQVEKMRFSKDKTQIYYNDYFTLVGIPAEAFAYQLGTRSALEWVVDQYRVKVDKRSGIVNDPNRVDQPQYIVDLIGRVITVSLETVEIVKNLPAL